MIRAQTQTALLAQSDKSKSQVISPPSGRQLCIFSARAYNVSGSAINVGLCRQLAATSWRVFRVTGGGVTYTEVTSAVQAGTATSLIDTTSNDGFIVASRKIFSVIGLTVSTAATGSPVYATNIWNGAAYAAATALDAPGFASTGDTYVSLIAPTGWVSGGPAGLSLLPGWYSLFVKATTAPSGGMSASAMWVNSFLDLQYAIASNGSMNIGIDSRHPLTFEAGESLTGYFGTANAANAVGAFYSFM